MLSPHPIAHGSDSRPPSPLRLCTLALMLVSACTPTPEGDTDGAAIVARAGDRTITRAEVESRIRGKLLELDIERYETLKQGLDELIDEILLQREAQLRNLSVDELLNTEVAAQTAAPSAEDVERFFDENTAQLGGRRLQDLRSSIEAYLLEQGTATRRDAFLTALREAAKVTISLRPPTIEVAAEGPSRGPADASVTIVEFSDFACPFCKAAAATLDRVRETYGENIRVVYRHYPLQPNSERAAQAASCAHEHGKFWEYHDRLFAHQDAQGDDALERYAREVGLDPDEFTECLTSGRTVAAVERDAVAGDAAGVNGTPSFFINGRPLSGAASYDAFTQAIEDALAETQSL